MPLTDDEIKKHAVKPDFFSNNEEITIVKLATRLLEVDARVKVLEEALEPFSKAADNFDSLVRERQDPNEWFAYAGQGDHQGTIGAITVADLRRARTALQEPVTLQKPEA
jgi:hypothetical protein